MRHKPAIVFSAPLDPGGVAPPRKIPNVPRGAQPASEHLARTQDDLENKAPSVWRTTLVDSRELLRKAIHIGVGSLALTLVFLGPLLSALLLSALLLLNLTLLPRYGARWLWRRDEAFLSPGVVAYPAVLLLLHLIFWHRVEIVATVWVMLALGDGMASIVGRSVGGPGLPWNPRKTWAGTVAYGFFGTLGGAVALGLTSWQLGQPMTPLRLLTLTVITAGVAAMVESLPQGLDDNITVPPMAAFVLLGLLESAGWQGRVDSQVLLQNAGLGLAANLLLGGLAFRLRAIDISGVLAGTAIGTVVFAFQGWSGFALLVSFVAVGSAVSRLGPGTDTDSPGARPEGVESAGRRSARNAIANMGMAAAMAVLASTTLHGAILLPAFVAAFSAALSDTVSSEVGPLFRGPVVLITSLEQVPAGTDGGISLVGTVAGATAALCMAGLGWGLGFFSANLVPWVATAGLLGNFVDSLAGALLERRGLLDNEGVNFLATAAAALAGTAFAALG